jgi:hypothetical protein
MVYTKKTWAVTTRYSAEALNHLETQYDEVMATSSVWNNHDDRYYQKTIAITKFFNPSYMGNGSGSDADLLDGHHASELLGTGLPVGAIVWWGEDAGSVPTGWHVCDGASGTTDYRDRFVIGTSVTYTVKNLYGAASVTPTTYSVSVGSTALDSTTIAAHTHGWTEYYNYPTSANYAYAQYGGSAHIFAYYTSSTTARTTGSQGSGTAHTHSGSTITWNSEANLPPYYAIYLIQRLS